MIGGGESGSAVPTLLPAPETPPLPGGPLRTKPIEINGKYFDPLNAPKLIKTADGKQEYQGGRELDKDLAYSMKFWSQARPDGLREAMQQSIMTSVKKGTFSNFAGVEEGTNELDEVTKEKLAAYRKLAEEMGYTIGSFKLNEDSGTVTAVITKTQPKQQS